MKKWIKKKMREFITWYVLKHEHGSFTSRRKGGAEQVCRVFSKQAHENIVKRAFECNGIFCQYSDCKHYFEDNCMLIFETDTVHISENGVCEDFEKGKHLGYSNE